MSNIITETLSYISAHYSIFLREEPSYVSAKNVRFCNTENCNLKLLHYPPRYKWGLTTQFFHLKNVVLQPYFTKQRLFLIKWPKNLLLLHLEQNDARAMFLQRLDMQPGKRDEAVVEVWIIGINLMSSIMQKKNFVDAFRGAIQKLMR